MIACEHIRHPGTHVHIDSCDDLLAKKAIRAEPLREGLGQIHQRGLLYYEADPAVRALIARQLVDARDQIEGDCVRAAQEALLDAEAEERAETVRRETIWLTGQRVSFFATHDGGGVWEELGGVGTAKVVDQYVMVEPDWYCSPGLILRNPKRSGLTFNHRGHAVDRDGCFWRIWPATLRHEERAWRSYLEQRIRRRELRWVKTHVLSRVADLLDADDSFYETEAETWSQAPPSPEWAYARQHIVTPPVVLHFQEKCCTLNTA